VSFLGQTVDANSFTYLYSYNQAGRVTANTLTAFSGSNLLTNLQATYAWDNQGRMTNLNYPSGTELEYQYDSMGRLSGITTNLNNGYAPSPIATATYTAASQLSTLAYPSFNESRTYNNLMQLTQLTNSGVNMQYNYTAGQNNGRVSSTTDNVLGETVNYTYDMWNRMTNAAATNGNWGEAYTFDGFGNLTGKTPTAGSAPALNSPVNTANNQPTGLGIYDANGNPQGNSPPNVPAYVWDVENRLASTATTDYTYDPWGRRMWKEVPGGLDANGNVLPTPCEIYFYGATGQKLETYSCINNGTVSSTLEGINIYFGRKLLQAKGVWVATDKLGSVRANSNGQAMSYFPYGEERENPNTPNGVEKFATYTRDAVGQDYAQQRYYNANQGAFWSPDPGGIRAANPTDPTSWNR
jgi:YD repeat-containing protein